jgi:hypothetical protein
MPHNLVIEVSGSLENGFRYLAVFFVFRELRLADLAGLRGFAASGAAARGFAADLASGLVLGLAWRREGVRASQSRSVWSA